MSFALLRQSIQFRIPLVRYSARTKRENRIQVQLLKDFPQYGQKGEIINVLPGLMRNKLYHNNGACYVNPKLGLHPRIPIVEKQTRPINEHPQKTVETTQSTDTEKVTKSKEEAEPVEIKGLLFDLPEDSATTQNFITSAESPYSLFQLEINLDRILISSVAKDGQLSIPVSKLQISQNIKQSTGIKIPESDIKIFQGEDEISEVSNFGEYELVISQGLNLAKISKQLIVESV